VACFTLATVPSTPHPSYGTFATSNQFPPPKHSSRLVLYLFALGCLLTFCSLAFTASNKPKALIPRQLVQSPFYHFIILQRHAKSSWENQTLPDFERPLEAGGTHDAKRIGRYLADHTSMGGVWEQAGSPNLIACSSSVRTKQTLSFWMQGFCEAKASCQLNNRTARFGEVLVPVIYAQAIYDARNGSDLLDYIVRMSVEARVLLFVGHSTALNELLEILTGGPPAVHFSTCGMALLGSQLSGHDWKRPGTFWLLDYVNPELLTID